MFFFSPYFIGETRQSSHTTPKAAKAADKNLHFIPGNEGKFTYMHV